MISNWRNILARRDLVLAVTKSELQSSTAETRLGWLWWLLDPLVMIGIYWVFIVIVFGRNTYVPYPIFVGCALLAWKHFAVSASQSIGVLRSRHALIKAVPFPTIVLPLSKVLTNSFYFLAGYLALAMAALLIGVPIGWSVVQIVPLFLLQCLLVTGVAMGLACLGVMLRDLESVITHALRIGWYLSPGIYGVNLVIERAGTANDEVAGLSGHGWIVDLYMMNPFAILFTGYRGALHDPAWLPPVWWAVLAVEAAVAFIVGYLIYQHYDRRVIKFI